MSPYGVSRVETTEVRAALVGDLANATVPTGIMGCTLVGISTYAHICMGSKVLLAAAVFGGAASAGKLALMLLHGRRNLRGRLTVAETDRWERAHGVGTYFMALSVGAAACAMFLGSDLPLQMLATGLIFGYGSGAVSRVGIRPRIAVTALLLAVVPSILAAALWADTAHSVIASVFGVFLLGSFETVRHVHGTALNHVGMRLEMTSLARNDPLTGLANRLGLREAFAALPVAQPLTVVFLDLDGFKPVNDRFGHAVGDVLLRMVGERLVATASRDATVARVGGDEFVVMQPGSRDEHGAAALDGCLASALREPFEIGAQRISIGASVGHSLAGAQRSGLDELLTRADEASYRVKRAGRARSRQASKTVPVRAVA